MNLQFFKIHFLLLLLFLCSIPSMFAQHGIGTNTPKLNAALDVTASDKGLLVPRLELNDAAVFFPGVTATASDISLLVFNTNTISTTASGLQGTGFYFWNGTQWEKVISRAENNLISSLVCYETIVEGTIFTGEAANITVNLPYTGGNGSSYAGGTVVQSGVELGMSGLTVTLQAGTLANRIGSLTYSITGTPTTSGNAYFGIDFGGDSCLLVVPINDSSSGGTAVVSNWDCSGPNEGTLFRGQAADGVTKVIYANVTKAGTYKLSITSNGITYSSEGSFAAPGNDIEVLLTASGTPAASRTSTYTLNTSPSCSFTREANTAVLPAGMAITNGDQTKFVGSIFDNYYSGVTQPAGPAVLGEYPVGDFSGPDTPVDIQGVIGSEGSADAITVTLDYTSTNVVDYDAFSTNVDVPAELIEGGSVPLNLTMSYPAGTTAVGSGTIVASIYATTTPINVRKLDINAGIGDTAPYGYPLASFSLIINEVGDLGEVGVRITVGIPDREFGDGIHDFLYLPVTSATGKTWLNHNLGAHYANINHASFNFTQQATTSSDYLAYGSQYQWGRFSDGHELVNWTSSTAGTLVNGTSTVNATSDTSEHNIFIIESKIPKDWRIPQNDGLWQGVDGTNNPCPNGYRLPYDTELDAERLSWNTNNSQGAFNSQLKLSLTGTRGSNSFLYDVGNLANYWADTVDGTNAFKLNIRSTTASVNSWSRSAGFSVRCIKD